MIPRAAFPKAKVGFMVRESSSVNGNKQRRDSRVVVPERCKEKVSGLAGDLGTVFRQKAPDQGVRIICGSRGSYPHESDAIGLLLSAWNRLPQAEKDRLITEYVDGYIGGIKTSKPELLCAALGGDTHEQ
jgi:hypothetical protein